MLLASVSVACTRTRWVNLRLATAYQFRQNDLSRATLRPGGLCLKTMSSWRRTISSAQGKQPVSIGQPDIGTPTTSITSRDRPCGLGSRFILKNPDPAFTPERFDNDKRHHPSVSCRTWVVTVYAMKSMDRTVAGSARNVRISRESSSKGLPLTFFPEQASGIPVQFSHL